MSLPATRSRQAIVVHGGAGPWPAHYRDNARTGVEVAARAGIGVLADGGSALDAVIEAVHHLEENPQFNAGIGAVLTRARTFEMDAAIMNGADLSFGAVAAMSDIAHPIDVARAVMEDGEHVLLCGEGAWAFAREHGFAKTPFAELCSEHALTRFEKEAAERRASRRAPADPGTVGACAIDGEGHVAAATSTGGITYKRVGRIGDTPVCGAGTYADDRGGAVSATGHGESVIRTVLGYRLVAHMRAGIDAWQAAWRVIAECADDLPGVQVGIICVDAVGRLGAAHSTPGMPIGAAALGDNGPVVIAQVVSEERRSLEALLEAAATR